MKNKRCLYCYHLLGHGMTDYHPECSKKMFDTPVPPLLDYDERQMRELAKEMIVQSKISLTGVQPKLSLDIGKGNTVTSSKRFTIVGLWGSYILKPPTIEYPHLPEVEDLTMHLAEIANIKTVKHCLIRLKSGELAYITKRMDRTKKGKIHLEDMCQLTERLTEDKYQGSYEQIGKTILKYSVNPGLDAVNFFEQVLFSFLTGNADMHLKNFSLINLPGMGYCLAPAYDMVATQLVNPDDNEELALTLNGKKRKIKHADFTAAFNTLNLDSVQQRNIFAKFFQVLPQWIDFIKISFLNKEMKQAYIELIKGKIQTIKEES